MNQFSEKKSPVSRTVIATTVFLTLVIGVIAYTTQSRVSDDEVKKLISESDIDDSVGDAYFRGNRLLQQKEIDWIASKGGGYSIVSKRWFYWIEAKPGIWSLSIYNYDMSEVDLSPLRKLKSLRTILLRSKGVDDEDMSFLNGMGALHGINVEGDEITGSFISELKYPKNITRISFVETSLNKEHVKDISRFTNLKSLALVKNDLEDADLEFLLKMKHLKLVKIGGSSFTDKALEILIKIESLDTIFLTPEFVERYPAALEVDNWDGVVMSPGVVRTSSSEDN